MRTRKQSSRRASTGWFVEARQVGQGSWSYDWFLSSRRDGGWRAALLRSPELGRDAQGYRFFRGFGLLVQRCEEVF